MSKLQDQLDQITANTRNLVQPERLEISERAVAELYATGAEDRILQVGSRAPEFALPDATGRVVKSADLLALGPLVINFFRGRWCPYCVTELETWRDLYGAVRKRGALLVGVSPQTVRQNDFTAVQHGLGFPVLTDAGCQLAAQFGLAYAVAPSQQQYCRCRPPTSSGRTEPSCLPAPMLTSAFARSRGMCWMFSPLPLAIAETLQF